MWDRDLVSRLSPKASQVLLSLLLSRSTSVQYTSAEFAKLTGLGQRSIAPALLELRDAGLIQIIAQPGKPPRVRLVHPEEAYETTVTESSPEAIESNTQPLLQEAVRKPSEERADVQGRSEDDRLAVERGLLDNCRIADESQDKALMVAAIQDVWEYAFPFKDYPSQRLSNDAAKRLLVNRSAEWVGRVILDAVKNAKSKIGSPRAYVEKAVVNQEGRERKGSGQVSEVPGINDELRNLARLGKEQFNAQSQDGG